MKHSLYKIGSWLLTGLWAGIVAYLNQTPQFIDAPMPFPHLDKLVHFTEYGVLAVLLSFSLWVSGVRIGRAHLFSFLIIICLAALDEWHQQFVPGRSGNTLDWLADSISACILSVLMYRIRLNRVSCNG
jgi:VanZ family protein